MTPTAGEVFYDLGSGTGKAVLTAAALHPLAAACGIEIQPRLHEAALAAQRAFEAIDGASLRAGRVALQRGDAFAEDAAWPETADLVSPRSPLSLRYIPHISPLYLPYISPRSSARRPASRRSCGLRWSAAKP